MKFGADSGCVDGGSSRRDNVLGVDDHTTPDLVV